MYTYHFALEAGEGKKLTQSRHMCRYLAEPPSSEFAGPVLVVEDFADRTVKLESSEWIGIVRLSAESLLEGLPVVLLVIGPGRICRERSSDSFRDGGRRRNMRTLGMETVLIGRILNGDGGSVGRIVGITSLDHLFYID